MQHNAYELEVFARTFHDFRMREAARVRMLDQAASGQARGARRFVGARLIAAARSWLAALGAGPARSAAPVSGDSPAPAATRPAISGHQAGLRRVNRAAEPYAAMVVLARSATPATEPSGVARDS